MDSAVLVDKLTSIQERVDYLRHRAIEDPALDDIYEELDEILEELDNEEEIQT